MAEAESVFAKIYLFFIGACITIFSSIACVALFYSLHKAEQTKNIYNYPTISSAIFYFISSIIFLVLVSIFDPSSDDNLDNNKKVATCVVLFALFLILAKLSVYTQFLARLWSSFQGTVLRLNKSTIIIAISLLCLLFIAVIWWVIIICIRFITLDRDFPGYYEQFVPLFIVLFICDFSTAWLVVGLFINKLFKTIMFKSRSEFFAKTGRYLNATKKDEKSPDEAHQNENGHAENSPTPNLEDEENKEDYPPTGPQKVRKTTDTVDGNLKQRSSSLRFSFHRRTDSFLIDLAYNSIDKADRERLDMITRQFLLSSLSIITTQLAYMSCIIMAIVFFTSDINQTAVVVIFFGVFYPSEVILNLTALYLNYTFGKDFYDKCCKCCHDRCSLWVVRRASKNILRRHSRELTTIDVHRPADD